MKERFDFVAEKAALTVTDKQLANTEYFDRRAKNKTFNTGDKVVALIPDDSNKLYSRWTGPVEAVAAKPRSSYRVKLNDGEIKLVHANKMRYFKAVTQAIGVIFEEEEHFGDISHTPSSSGESENSLDNLTSSDELDHLTNEQGAQLAEILSRPKDVFAGKMRVAYTHAHQSKLKPNAERTQPYVYRIPEALEKDK